MFRPTIKSNLSLTVMAVLFIGLYYWSNSSTIVAKAPNYSQKIEAATTMLNAMQVLTEYYLPMREARKGRGGGDPLSYTMLGEKDSPITTDEGSIEEKITTLNPNFAAVMVDLLQQGGARAGDTIAVMLTGSMPGANLALFAAAKTLKLNVVAITSVGSSWWGANAPDLTWLDMERILADKGIFTYRSIGASLGGADDEGGLRLSEHGRTLIKEAVDRNGVTLIQMGSLSANIEGRMQLLARHADLHSYRLVVNIGGGVAAIGNRENGKLIPTGVNSHLPARNYPNLGVVHRLAAEGAAIVHIYDIHELARKFNLPVAELPLPAVGEGPVFAQEVYNRTIAAIALVFMLLILAVVKYFDVQAHRWREHKTDPDAFL